MGVFVTIEGPNGAGKSTFINQLEKILPSTYSIFLTKEPSESNIGDYVRSNENHLEGNAYAYLIAADRCYHLEKIIEPEIKSDKIVLSDRYIESSLVLQTFDGVQLEDIWRLNCKFRVPDISIILLGTKETLDARLAERTNLTHFERKMTRQEEIEGYLKAADYVKSKGFHPVIFNNNTEEEMQENLNITRNLIIDIVERNKVNAK